MIAISITNDLHRELIKHKAIGSFISIKHLEKMKNELVSSKLSSCHGETIYNNYVLKYFDFESVLLNSSLKSICIVATPSPINIVKFHIEDNIIDIEIPPIYADKRATVSFIKDITSPIIAKWGNKTVPISLPKKLLAVHSGIAKYGYNNLVYVKGMGSFNRLTAFATDIQCDNEEWYSLTTLDQCKTCGACKKACPTKALAKEFIVNTDKCITAYDDYPGDFPSWIDKSWHNSLVGCTICQKVCPINRPYLSSKKEVASFNAKESNLIISETAFNKLPNELRQKIKCLSLDIYYQVLARNLKVLIQNSTFNKSSRI